MFSELLPYDLDVKLNQDMSTDQPLQLWLPVLTASQIAQAYFVDNSHCQLLIYIYVLAAGVQLCTVLDRNYNRAWKCKQGKSIHMHYTLHQ